MRSSSSLSPTRLVITPLAPLMENRGPDWITFRFQYAPFQGHISKIFFASGGKSGGTPLTPLAKILPTPMHRTWIKRVQFRTCRQTELENKNLGETLTVWNHSWVSLDSIWRNLKMWHVSELFRTFSIRSGYSNGLLYLWDSLPQTSLSGPKWGKSDWIPIKKNRYSVTGPLVCVLLIWEHFHSTVFALLVLLTTVWGKSLSIANGITDHNGVSIPNRTRLYVDCTCVLHLVIWT